MAPVGGIADLDVMVDVPACEVFARGDEVARDLIRRLEVVTQEAKRLCPVSPAGSEENGSGYLRSSIGWSLGQDLGGLYGDIGTDVDYALPVELGSGPHVIESHGDYPLANRRTGQVFGRRVNHPGAAAQPFLRPALIAAGRI